MSKKMLAALVSGSQSLLASPTRCSVPMMAMQAPASPQVASWYDTGQRLSGSVVPLMPEGGWPSRGGGGGQHRMAGRWAGDAKREYFMHVAIQPPTAAGSNKAHDGALRDLRTVLLAQEEQGLRPMQVQDR